MSTTFLQLMQLADSAAPIGSASHSYGLETLVVEEAVVVDDLESFLTGYLEEAGVLEAAYCREAFTVATTTPFSAEEWIGINREMSALKPARESRAAGGSLGKRFLQMSIALAESSSPTEAATTILSDARNAAVESRTEIHYCTAFGLVAGALGLPRDETVQAYVQQSVTGLVSACQRLMPLGQTRAAALLWRLKPAISRAASARSIEEATCFTPVIEMASMRHPGLTTRLFIS